MIIVHEIAIYTKARYIWAGVSHPSFNFCRAIKLGITCGFCNSGLPIGTQGGTILITSCIGMNMLHPELLYLLLRFVQAPSTSALPGGPFHKFVLASGRHSRKAGLQDRSMFVFVPLLIINMLSKRSCVTTQRLHRIHKRSWSRIGLTKFCPLLFSPNL